MKTERTFVIFGGLFGFAAVAAGAFGAHFLRQSLQPEMLSVFETGARYQMYHSLALLAAAWQADRNPGWAAGFAGWSFVAGIILFSGSLYLLALTNTAWIGAITPLGGMAFLAGWLGLAWSPLMAARGQKLTAEPEA
jgi:uncharacterized membrane protein YgdD (TMEM256/DUF423 family)